jgi:hypothetical protein
LSIFWVVLIGFICLCLLQFLHVAKHGGHSSRKSGGVSGGSLGGGGDEHSASGVGPQFDDPVEGKDSWEGGFWDASSPCRLKKRLRLEYRDGSGAQTARVVDVRAFDVSADLLIGHCHLRGATRTFRFSRMIECVDFETGEIIANPLAYFVAEYEKTPHGAVDSVLNSHWDAMMVLFYVSKLDGRMTRQEADVLAGFCKALTGNTRITGLDVRDMLKDFGAPSIGSFRLAVGREAKSSLTDRARLLVACKMLVETKRTAHSSERDALIYLQRKLAPDAAGWLS